MKIQSARISLTLWTSKVLADGTSPIMLAIRFNGQSLLSSHFSCKPKDWNAKDECLKRTYPNYAAVNKILQDMKNQAIAAKLQFETNGTPYTAKMIVAAMKPKDLSAKSLKYEDIMKQLIEDRNLKYTTSKLYYTVFNSLSEFMCRADFIVTELTDELVIKYAEWLQSQNHTSNSILAYFGRIISVVHFANEKEISDHYPKQGFSWVSKNFKKEIHHKALSEESLEKLRYYYLTMDKVDPFKRKSKTFALSFYLGLYSMFGLAPIDGARLKIDQFEDTVVNGQNCWKVTTKRSKTNVPVSIIVKKDSFSATVLMPYITTADERDGYIFPILGGYHYTSEKQEQNLISRIQWDINNNLKEIASEIGLQPFTLYSLRHSFATHSIAKGANLGLLANALGRSVSGIGVYISNLSKDSDLLHITTD